MAPAAPTSPLDEFMSLASSNWLLIVLAVTALGVINLILARIFPTPAPTAAAPPKRPTSTSSPSSTAPFLDPAEFKALPLADKTLITHNTLSLRFDLPNPRQRLGLPIGQHISFMAKDQDGKDVYRSYTPISDDDQLGSVTFVIKIYPQGKMSQIIQRMNVGDTMLMKGPKGRLTYVPNMKKNIGMIAGGSGITPMYQVLSAILKDPKDKTQVRLVFGNVTEEDILLRTQLDEMVAMHVDRLKVHYVLDKPPASGWNGGSGYITQATVKEHLPAPGPDTLILRCGPTPMMEAMKQVLEGSGFSQEQQFQF